MANITTRVTRARAPARIQMRWKFPPDRSSQRIKKKSRFCPRARGTSDGRKRRGSSFFSLPSPFFCFCFSSPRPLARKRVSSSSSSSFGVARSKFIHAQRRKFSPDFRPPLKVAIFFDNEMYFFFLSFSSFTREINCYYCVYPKALNWEEVFSCDRLFKLYRFPSHVYFLRCSRIYGKKISNNSDGQNAKFVFARIFPLIKINSSRIESSDNFRDKRLYEKYLNRHSKHIKSYRKSRQFYKIYNCCNTPMDNKL